jgi:hypothetical protein
MLAAALWFAFGAITALLSLQLPVGTLRGPGSGFFPLVLGLMLMGLAAGHGAQLFLARPTPAAEPRPAAAPAPRRLEDSTRRVLLFIATVVIATALLPRLGYTLVSFLLMLALLQILGVRRRGLAGLIAASSAIASHLLFVRWLGIPLPTGWLRF